MFSRISNKSLLNIVRKINIDTKIEKSVSAFDVFNKSCYHKLDFKINEHKTANEAVTRFSVFKIGCLAVTNKDNKVVGVISERDYITKVSAKRLNDNDVKVKDICTYGPDIIIAKKSDSLDVCMQKMMFRDIRHLLVIDDKQDDFIGMISIKDLIKEIQKEKDEIIMRLGDFKIGKGAYFGSEW